MRGKWVIQVGLASTSPAYIKAWHAVQGCFGVSRTSLMFENIRQKWNEFSWSQNWEDSEWLLGQPPVTSNCGWSNEETDHPLRLCSIVNPLSFSWSQGIWSKNNLRTPFPLPDFSFIVPLDAAGRSWKQYPQYGPPLGVSTRSCIRERTFLK